MLFADPVTLNDGTNDHVFNYRGQLPSPSSRITEWVELAASAEASPIILVKHDLRKPSTPRANVTLRQNVHPAANTEDTVYYPVTFGFTSVLGHKSILYSDVEDQFATFLAMLNNPNFLAYVLKGMG